MRVLGDMTAASNRLFSLVFLGCMHMHMHGAAEKLDALGFLISVLK